MPVYFESLGSLGSHIANTGIEVVDAGMPLTEWSEHLALGPRWKNQPAIRKVTSFIARNVASTSMHLFERRADNDRNRVHDGPLAALLRRPSRAPGLTAYRFWEGVLLDGLVHDRWCARVVHHDDGPELVRIPARMVKFHADSLDRVDEVRVTNSEGEVKEYDPAEFIIDAGYAERGANGTSPLETLRDILEEYRQAVLYRQQLMRNGARTQLVLVRNTPWSSDAAQERFSRGWRSYMQGGGKEGGTPILEDGLEPKEINSFRPRDTLDLEGRKLTDIEVASAYHIAPELLGAREGTFANIRAFRQMLYGVNLWPYFEAWTQQLNATLVPLLEPNRDVYIEANIDSKLRGSFEEQADILSTSVGAPWLTRNEARALVNKPAIDGGDELITPLNVLVGGQSSPQDGKAARDVVEKFAERQEQVVKSQRAAGVSDWWDPRRWDRELTADLEKAGIDYGRAAVLARAFNADAEERFMKETTA